jgi:hypothetical protein
MPLRLVALGLLLAASAVAQEDVVTLKSGAEFRGRIISETGGVVRLQFPGGVVDLRPETVAGIERARRDPEVEADTAILAGLDRVPDGEDWYFLYRDGVRVGWRHVRRTREIRQGVAGYVRADRRVFTKKDGGPAEVDLTSTEFVDADLRPRAVSRRLVSGPSLRVTEGVFEDGRLLLEERAGSAKTARRAPCDAATELPGVLGERLAREPRRSGTGDVWRVFDPVEATFAEIAVARGVKRATAGGRVLDVVALRATRAGTTTEAWYDLHGRPVREELGGASLVAVRAEAERVRAFAAGEAVGDDDLGLKVTVEAAGLSFTRPDPTWETAAGDVDGARLASLVRAAGRATCDMFVLPREGRLDDDAACLDVLARVEGAAERGETIGPDRVRYGENRGVKFLVDGVRRGSLVRTLGFVFVRDERVFVFLCAAPPASFADAAPAFERLLASVDVAPKAPSPKEPAASVLDG